MINRYTVRLTVLLFLVAADIHAGELLFKKVSRDYDAEGVIGKTYREEFEPRMFKHATWTARLYCNPYEPDIDETLELFTKPDGSHCLSYRRASPSLSRFIGERLWLNEQFDLKKKLNAVRINEHEVALPEELANEIKLLWQRMLHGLQREPKSNLHSLVVHAPAVIAFAREGTAVETGRIPMAAFNTQTYRAFIEIVDDLIKACEHRARSNDPVFIRLSDKIRSLRNRL
jgi:hypothetical protein